MKRLSLVLLSAAYLALGIATASAQEKYPSHPIKIIVPYAPGGATDIAARILGDEIQKITGQGVVVLNKPGAFGLLAIEEMVKSPPDGYTLMLGNVSTNAITPIIYAKKLSVDYAKSVVAVSNLVDVPAFLLVTTANDFPPKTVAEFVDYAKKNPGKVNYGTVGVGSYPHYDMAYFAKTCRRSKPRRPAQQKRRLRRDHGHAARRRAVGVPQRRQHCRSGAGRQIPRTRGGQPHAASGISQHPDHARGRLPGCRHRRLERTVRAGGNAQAGAGSAVPVVAKALSRPT